MSLTVETTSMVLPRPAKIIDQNTLLLFFKEPVKDRFFPGDRYLRPILRPAYNLMRKGHFTSGFYVAFDSLVRALRSRGMRVEVNNYRLAREYPDHPVGLIGFPAVLEDWDLPNPAILGVGLYDHPGVRPDLMEDERFRLYVVHSAWMRELFERFYGSCVVEWYAGIDTQKWTDTRGCEKDLDLIIYDKILWNREQTAPALLAPIIQEVEQRKLRYHVLRYGNYQHKDYAELLARSRGLVFLCEHETQGQAYQEAMSSNVPILAWDNGLWLDPVRLKYHTETVPASSVPFFSPECGERFRGGLDFPDALARFTERLDTYEPRRFVERELSMKGSADTYLRHYRSLF